MPSSANPAALSGPSTSKANTSFAPPRAAQSHHAAASGEHSTASKVKNATGESYIQQEQNLPNSVNP